MIARCVFHLVLAAIIGAASARSWARGQYGFAGAGAVMALGNIACAVVAQTLIWLEPA